MNAPRSLSRLPAIAGCCLALWIGLPGAPGSAQTGPEPPPAVPDFYPHFDSCEDMKAQCKDASAEAIYEAVLLSSWGQPPIKLGVCYVHDKTNCPGCRCNDYIKQTWRSGAKGADGGTGCVGWPSPPRDPEISRAMAAALLKKMCEEGQCCCPQVEEKPCPNPNRVRRCGDGISQACCTFPNECSAPGAAEGWH